MQSAKRLGMARATSAAAPAQAGGTFAPAGMPAGGG
jgi:hypothetical protein